MDRREFLCYCAPSFLYLSGCLSEEGTPENPSSEVGRSTEVDIKYTEDLPEHTRWLYDPSSVELGSEDDWYGYILVNPSKIPEAHPWSRIYEEFGIEMNLKHYAVDTDMTGGGYSGIDITRYSSEEYLEDASPYETAEVEGLRSGKEILVDRPASTGGSLEDQEVIDRIGEFEIYERHAAVNRQDNVTITGLDEYMRRELAPAVIRTGPTNVGDWAGNDYYRIWEHLEVEHYVEVGLNPTELPTYPNFHSDDVTAFARSNRILSENEIEVTQVELFTDEDAVDDEYMLSEIMRDDVDEARQQGRAMVYTTVVDEVVTAYMD